MIRIAALNDSDSSDEEEKLPEQKGATKEAQEAEAFTLYNRALSLLKQGESTQANYTFHQLLNLPIIKEAAPLVSEDEGLVQPELMLKYSGFKNLAALAAQNNNYKSAMEHYLEAVHVDSSDVTIWYKIGVIAIKLDKYQLAKYAFEQGLECNPRHWPCLDSIITVMYALNNYEVCLLYIGRALQRDSGYVKGLAFMEQIFSEHPRLRLDSQEMFAKCDQAIYDEQIDIEERREFVDEALEMRRQKRELEKPRPMAVMKFTPPLKEFTWKCLGEELIKLYNDIDKQLKEQQDPTKPTLSFSCRVDLSDYMTMDPVAITPQPAAMAPAPGPVISSLADAAVSTVPTTPSTPVLDVDKPVDEQMDYTEENEKADVNQTPRGVESSEAMMGTADLSVVTPTDMPVSQPLPAVISEQIDSAMDLEEISKGLNRKGTKRKRLPFNEDLLERRKSARVRNTTRRKEQEVINFQLLLRKFLPSSLLEVQAIDEEESIPVTPVGLSPSGSTAVATVGTQNSAQTMLTERQDVHSFISSHQVNNGVIDLLNEYLIALAHRDGFIWSSGLPDIYIEAYNKVRKHILYPGFLCKDVPDSRLKDMAHMCLVQAELKVDRWNSNKAKLSVNISPKRSETTDLSPPFLGPYFNEDMIYLVGISPCSDILGTEFHSQYRVRAFWMKSCLMVLQGDMDYALDCLDRTSDYLKRAQLGQGDGTPVVVRVPNCTTVNNITLASVVRQLDSLRRCQSLEEVQRLHDLGDHSKVVELLLQTFSENKVLEGLQERHAQLLLLQDSLIKMADYKRCLYWSEVSVNEALKKYLSTLSCSGKEEWVTTMTKLFKGMDRVLCEDLSIVQSLPSKSLVRLVSNLLRIIDFAMDVPEGATDMAISTLLPWILLYRLIKHEEKRLESISLESSPSSSTKECMPSSLMLLNMAHEYLGRRSWCVNYEGEILLFCVSELYSELHSGDPEQHPFRGELTQGIEQCFYCLYGHPNKRAKAKHLTDHNVPQLTLTWERCEKLFEYYKPKTVPEYDSYKTSTVSGELENLLRRISQLVPTMANPANTVDTVAAYIEGNINSAPTIPEGMEINMPIVNELYYLLADYYFKNKEPAKAIKFYLHDICYNPERFDSWAGMALARANRLEQKLKSYYGDIDRSVYWFNNEHEIKPEAPIQKQATSTLNCFKRALELDDSNSKLWIEYGFLAYQLHSHASRQLKQCSAYVLSEELIEQAKTNKTEMLRIAGNSYTRASEGQADEESEEEWLPHYMLGKVAEKSKKHPKVYLQHYKMALHHLHHDQAKYPKKITYYYSAPHLAVESLELFYRLHVCVVKYLMTHLPDGPVGGADSDIPYDLFEEYLTEAAKGPFALAQEMKTPERKNSERQDGSIDESSCSNLTPPANTSSVVFTSRGKDKKSATKQLPDHTYSKQKVTSESSEQSSQESMDFQSPDGAGGYSLAYSPCRFSATSPRAQLLPPSPVVSGQPSITPAVTSPQFAPPLSTSSPACTRPSQAFSMESILGTVIEKQLLTKSGKAERKAVESVDNDAVVSAGLLSHEVQVEEKLLGNKEPSSQLCLTSEMSQDDPPVLTNQESMPDLTQETKVPPAQSSPPHGPPMLRNDESLEVSPPKLAEEITTPNSTGVIEQDIFPSLVLEEDELAHLKEVASPKPQGINLPSPTSFESSSGSLVKPGEHENVIGATAVVVSADKTRTVSVEDKDNSFVTAPDPSTSFLSEMEFIDIDTPDLETGLPTVLTLQEESVPAVREQMDYTTVESGPGGWGAPYDVREPVPMDSCNVIPSLSRADTGPFVVSESYVNMAEEESSAVAVNPDEASITDPILLTDGAGDEKEKEAVIPDTEDRGRDTIQTVKQDGLFPISTKVTSKKEPVMILDPQTGEFVVQTEEDSSADESVEKQKTEISTCQPAVEDQSHVVKKEDQLTSVKESVKTEAAGITEKVELSQMTGKCKTSEDLLDNSLASSDDKKILPPIGDETAMATSDSTKEMKTDGQPKELTEGVGDRKTLVQDPTGLDKKKEEDKAEPSTTKNKENSNGEGRYRRVMTLCMDAFQLCLSRFPQHYKSIYRLCYIYYYSKDYRNIAHCADLLLGTPQWQKLEHMPCMGLFSERKNTNFFQGLWKIPIEEVDRAGSFATHLRRTMLLLFEVLRDGKNPKLLFQLHHWLTRTPDQGKKYLRDCDRLNLARVAYEHSVSTAQSMIPDIAKLEEEECTKQLLEIHKIWQHGVKNQTNVNNVNKMFAQLYTAIRKDQVDTEPTVLEQAIRYCQQLVATKAPQTPTGEKGLLNSPSVTKSTSMTSHSLFGSVSPMTPDTAEVKTSKLAIERMDPSNQSAKEKYVSPAKVSSPVKSSGGFSFSQKSFPGKIPEPTRVAKHGDKGSLPLKTSTHRPKSLSLSARKSTGELPSSQAQTTPLVSTKPMQKFSSTGKTSQKHSSPKSTSPGTGGAYRGGRYALTHEQRTGSAPISPELLAELITQQQMVEAVQAQQRLAEAIVQQQLMAATGRSQTSLGMGAISPYDLWASSLATSALYSGVGSSIDLSKSTSQQGSARSPASNNQPRATASSGTSRPRATSSSGTSQPRVHSSGSSQAKATPSSNNSKHRTISSGASQPRATSSGAPSRTLSSQSSPASSQPHHLPHLPPTSSHPRPMSQASTLSSSPLRSVGTNRSPGSSQTHITLSSASPRSPAYSSSSQLMLAMTEQESDSDCVIISSSLESDED